MTVEEFSNEFDTLFNLSNNIDINLNEYEKSVFLTKAQEEILLSYYNGTNSKQEGYDASEEIRRYLNALNSYIIINPFKKIQDEEAKYGNLITDSEHYSDYIIPLPDDVWFITLETIKINSDDKCLANKRLEVVPITQDEFHRIINNPFRGVNERRALRIETDTNKIELICKYKDYNYYLYYVSKPSPIILTNIGDLSINGISIKQECKLHEALHRPILQRAVQLALISKGLMKQQ